MNTAIYLRVSTADQSTTSQKREVMAFVNRIGWKKTKVYQDTVSGSKASRPGLDKMLQDARAGVVDRVVAYKLDRLGRSLSHFLQLASELGKLKIPIICTSQGIDTSADSASGRLFMQVLGAVAEFERELIRERVVSGLNRAKANGVVLGRRNRHGKYVDQIKRLRGDGVSIRDVAAKLRISKSAVERCLK
jgi:DNA invertase Pin-like site-specific DNA recombinase